MNLSDLAGVLIAAGSLVTAVWGLVKVRADARSSTVEGHRADVELHITRQDKEIARQAEELEKLKARQDAAEARERLVLDYATTLRLHIAEGKPPPPPPWPPALTNQ